MAVVSGTTQLTSNDQQTPSGVPIPSGQSAANPLAYQLNARSQYNNGTALDLIDLIYFATLTFVASTPQVLDLTSLTDPFGGAINFKRVKKIVIKPHGLADAVTLTLGYGTTTTNAWTGLFSNPGTIALQAAPTPTNDAFLAVNAPNATGYLVGSSSKLLKLDPGSAAFTVDIEIAGCSA